MLRKQLVTSVIPGIFAISAVRAHCVDLMQRRGVWAVRKPPHSQLNDRKKKTEKEGPGQSRRRGTIPHRMKMEREEVTV